METERKEKKVNIECDCILFTVLYIDIDTYIQQWKEAKINIKQGFLFSLKKKKNLFQGFS